MTIDQGRGIDAVLLCLALPCRQLQRQLGSLTRHQLDGVTHGGELGPQVSGVDDVVKTHHRDLLRHPQPVVRQHRDGTGRHGIVIGHHGGHLEPLGQQVEHGALAPLLIRRAALDKLRIGRQISLCQPVLIPLQPQGGIFDSVIRTDKGDVAMAQLDQMTGCGCGPQPVVEGNAAPLDGRNIAIDKHHAGHPHGVVAELFVAQRLAVHHQRLAALADQQLDRLALLARLVKTVTHQQVKILLYGHAGDPLHQSPEEGISHVSHHDAHGIAGLADQRPRVGVGGIAQLRHRLLDGGAGGGAGLGRVVHHP